ncbi:VOC family protein [Elioraea tepidiphila]|uniref:VOC family protein n=1 Tax=Elioraea tepidiphila TaxID=457934 RepID=UPI002FD92762
MATTLETRTDTAHRLAIGEVALRVRDLDRAARFYRDAIGLEDVPAPNGAVGLGAGGVRLLTLVGDADARQPDALSAGLFHTAFLLPSRAALAGWLAHAIARQLPIDGASDHLVSEAIYLADPEGNGIEVYADRPRSAWRWDTAGVAMDTRPLDCRGLLATATSGPAHVLPAGTRVGHVHLKVGDTIEAESFWTASLGMDVTSRRPGAVFMAADGYHHHVAANAWMSRGAGPRDHQTTGLMWFSVAGRDLPDGGVTDRWGNRAVPA